MLDCPNSSVIGMEWITKKNAMLSHFSEYYVDSVTSGIETDTDLFKVDSL